MLKDKIEKQLQLEENLNPKTPFNINIDMYNYKLNVPSTLTSKTLKSVNLDEAGCRSSLQKIYKERFSF